MFEEPEYLFREESGEATVCLVKDLETAAAFDVDSITSDNSALSMNPPVEHYNKEFIIMALGLADVSDYIGGTFTVTFETDANDVKCFMITLISDNDREERENFFVDLVLDDMGPIRPGDPSRTIVNIEGSAHTPTPTPTHTHTHTHTHTPIHDCDTSILLTCRHWDPS